MKPLGILAVIGAVIAAVMIMGPPSRERARKIDGRRVEDLRVLRASIDTYHSRFGVLPASDGDAMRETGQGASLTDPVSGQPYVYHAVSADTYELCAHFQQNSGGSREYDIGFWSHPAGFRCFQFKPGGVSQ